MDFEVIEQIAQQVVDRTIAAHLPVYIVSALLLLVVGATASFLGSYFRARGEQRAAKAAFEEVLEQLRRSTEVAERVRSDVVHELHDKQTTPVLYRNKIEELFELTYVFDRSLEEAREAAVAGERPNFDATTLGKIQTLQQLYFPAAEAERERFAEKAIEYAQWMGELALAKMKGNNQRYEKLFEEFVAYAGPCGEAGSELRESVLKHYRDKARIPSD